MPKKQCDMGMGKGKGMDSEPVTKSQMKRTQAQKRMVGKKGGKK